MRPSKNLHLQVVLREVIESLGGWEAAVFLDSGGVNLDVDVLAWPAEDQVLLQLYQYYRATFRNCANNGKATKVF